MLFPGLQRSISLAERRECRSRRVDAVRAGSGSVLYGRTAATSGLRVEPLRRARCRIVWLYIYVCGGECEHGTCEIVMTILILLWNILSRTNRATYYTGIINRWFVSLCGSRSNFKRMCPGSRAPRAPPAVPAGRWQPAGTVLADGIWVCAWFPLRPGRGVGRARLGAEPAAAPARGGGGARVRVPPSGWDTLLT